MTLLEQKRVLAVVRKQDLPFLNSLLARQDALVVDPDGGNTGCVIMASGLGKRFGGNKLMESLRGKPMIAWALEAAEGVFQKIVVVTRHESVKAWCDAQGIQTVLHDLPYRSDTVRLGLQALGDVDSCLFLPGDQPFVTKDSLYAMALAAKAHDAIWQLGGAAPVLFPKWTFPELLTLPEGKGGGVLVKKYETFVKSLPPALPWELQDVDTKEDLAQLASGMCCQV
ncbi:MAG: nucleotidyltransferase family protein [Oscillospiraceae bacterium]|nr:nucleotidyltransferase family protein [Oscillospiraceae bacterium]